MGAKGVLKYNLAGQRFGRLLVLSKDFNHGKHETWWKCQCDCGKETSVRSSSLVKGSCKSCGCLRSETMRNNHIKHGMTDKSIHNVWMGMRARCKNKNLSTFKDYGGRGITVCEEWNDFSTFYDWALKNGYEDGLTIDRINNDKGYEPSNCRWVDMKHQCWNRRNSYMISYQGKKKSLAEWCDELHLSYSKTYQRIHNLNWSAQKAFET